jgi:ribosomal 50S subunit-recycling heat shock protein
MRLDLFLSRVGIVKRRAIAKQLADSGLITLNGHPAKPSREIKEGDIIIISGKKQLSVEILMIPAGSVKKEDREKYCRQLGQKTT